jgi:hypothetical protein
MSAPWVGVDFDGTLAVYDGWQEPGTIGGPVMPMVDRIQKILGEGMTVKIFTARSTKLCHIAIREFCQYHFGEELEITNQKDRYMIYFFDDRAVRVVKNVGAVCCTHFDSGVN